MSQEQQCSHWCRSFVFDNKPQHHLKNSEFQNSILIVENKIIVCVHVCGLKKYHICLNSDVKDS
jgi:hypothetical protein